MLSHVGRWLNASRSSGVLGVASTPQPMALEDSMLGGARSHVTITNGRRRLGHFPRGVRHCEDRADPTVARPFLGCTCSDRRRHIRMKAQTLLYDALISRAAHITQQQNALHAHSRHTQPSLLRRSSRYQRALSSGLSNLSNSSVK